VRYLSIFFEIKDLDRTNPEEKTLLPTAAAPIFRYESQIDPAHAGFSNFRFPSRGTEPFLTESLILAQNERWRRG